MRRLFAVVCLAAPVVMFGESASPVTKPATESAARQAGSALLKDLPVRKVILYKNGVGYLEHAGSVTGNQRVSIDFTSSQLNDVLQSLTVLDEGGGRIAGVNYNSTTPLAEQLKTLGLGLADYPDTLDIYHSLRGQRVEVSGSGAPYSGRIVNIEYRSKTDKDGDISQDHYFLIVTTDSGALRTVELTDAVSVRMTDPAMQKLFASYLEILAGTQNQTARHLTLNAIGQGERQLRVSYISEVPVWKSTYRIVFPQDSSGGDRANAIMQGWAVVDNTVGADWDNVQLSLVAGSPQSFIQPLSQPLYTRRREIAIATAAETTPQTHEAAEYDRLELGAKLFSAPPPPSVKTDRFIGGGEHGKVSISAGVASGGGGGFGYGAGLGSGAGGGMGGGVYRVSDAMAEGDVSTNAFDDFFEYALTQPVTIHKNEAAMVPILQQELPAEHVTLWNPAEKLPLRAVWVENNSKLTLDSGSFSIFENGEFAGEGLLDPIHPGEKRLLSYAADQAVKVRRSGFDNARTLHHVAMHKGILVETTSEVTDTTYTVRNGADEARTVILEHPRKPEAELTSDSKPAETSATTYRFRQAMKPHETTELHVRERANIFEKVRIDPAQDRTALFIAVSKFSPELEANLKGLIEAEQAVSDLNSKMAELEQKEKQLGDDETRARENVTALKGNEAGKRFVEELGRAEDELQASRKQRADLEKSRDIARAKLDALIGQVSFDTNLTVATPATHISEK